PLPRAQAFLRMIDIDPATGVLVTSYGNIVDVVQGPRMALIIDPGDGAYPQKFTTANAMPARGNANQDFGSPLGNFIGQGTAGMDGAALATAARCQSCHQAEGASLGPPWAAIAARHAGADQAQREALARKIVDG